MKDHVITVGPAHRRHATPRVLALGGGKGGSGRTLLAANLAIYLAQMGKKVVVIDASIGAANLHTLLALECPPVGVSDFLSGRVTQVDDVLRPVPGITGGSLQMIAGVPAMTAVPSKREAKLRLLERLRGMDFDFIMLDLDSGATPETLDFFLAADVRVAVVAPELTAIERHWQFLEAAIYRDAFGPGVSADDAAWSRRAFDLGQREGGFLPPPTDLVDEVGQHDPAAAAWLRRRFGRLKSYVHVNQARTTSDSRLLEGLRSVSRRRFGVSVEALGPVDFDDTAWLSVRRRRPLVLEYPESPATRVIGAIARRIVIATSAQASAAAADNVVPIGAAR